MSALRSRNKGKRGEREIATLIREAFAAHGISAEVERNSLQSRRGGADLCGEHVRHWAVEVKYQERESLSKWEQQAVSQTEDGQTPVVVYRRNRRKWKARVLTELPFVEGTQWVEVDLEVWLEWIVKHWRHVSE